ncbi:hypothetical protein BURPS1106B_A0079 [Burkholderia pseudomallei 1106b]|uniref:Uncharacterized protein n=1 Tax=Burkholderia pseudomallei (strain 1106a) TaxID=357348 RepID=A3NRY8_BURP0|nr:hypothetical protein BURPS1106A_0828 [Burkholderia pseudomallei 1106a]AFR14705.1 hypothetical protein BPC006_I0818 [Burkholderia pseudomallei BPC006]EES23788.1 hypothetical protein BURPS1106B_A0079 [Burkholderia pseudomallei 1106b]
MRGGSFASITSFAPAASPTLFALFALCALSASSAPFAPYAVSGFRPGIRGSSM